MGQFNKLKSMACTSSHADVQATNPTIGLSQFASSKSVNCKKITVKWMRKFLD